MSKEGLFIFPFPMREKLIILEYCWTFLNQAWEATFTRYNWWYQLWVIPFVN